MAMTTCKKRRRNPPVAFARAVLCICGMVAAVGPAPAGAAKPAPTSPLMSRARLVELKNALDAHRAALRDLNNKERSLIVAVSALDRDFMRLSDQHDAARAALGKLQKRLVPLRKTLAEAEARLEESQLRLQKRLRALYVLSRGGAARHLLGAQSFTELSLRRRLLEGMARDDARLVETYRERVVEVNSKRAALAERMRDAQDIEERIAEEEDILSATRKERAATMRRIDAEKELGVRAVKDIVKEQRAVESELRSRLPRVIRPRRGKGVLKAGILRPVTGGVIRNFGTVRDAVSKAKVTSNGIHIRAPLGAPVVAAAAGRVVYTGWQRGLGRIVILDHEEGHHTIYGHLSRAVVQQADRVMRGQSVGFVGDTASLEGTKLYLELRENGRPKNPAPYLRNR